MADVTQISTRELKSLIEEQAVAVIDVREPKEHAQGVIPGARLMPLGQVATRYKELPKDRRLAMVCRSGRRSQQAAEFLVLHGYDAVNVAGGMLEWEGPTEQPS